MMAERLDVNVEHETLLICVNDVQHKKAVVSLIARAKAEALEDATREGFWPGVVNRQLSELACRWRKKA